MGQLHTKHVKPYYKIELFWDSCGCPFFGNPIGEIITAMISPIIGCMNNDHQRKSAHDLPFLFAIFTAKYAGRNQKVAINKNIKRNSGTPIFFDLNIIKFLLKQI